MGTLRKALRIALPEGKHGLNDDGDDTDMKTIKEKVKGFREQMVSDSNLSQKDEYKKMIQQIDTYWEKRFARIDSNIVVQELKKSKKEAGRLPLELKKLIREPAFPEKLGLLFGC